MPERKVILVNKRGLHARAASKLVQIASEFDCDVTLVHGDREADGKNIMSLLMLAAPVGTEMLLRTCGADDAAALERLCDLIANRFDEDE